jgi:fucose-1-phosphate guanylyltransferase
MATLHPRYNHLKGTRLNVVLCNWSKFYHIGTLAEFLHHYCSDPVFYRELGCTARTFTTEAAAADAPEACLIHSTIGKEVRIGSQSVLEYAVVADGCTIGSRCMISSVVLPPLTSVPAELFLHTTSTKDGFVTIVFGTQEDLKTGAKPDVAAEKLTYCNTKLGDAMGRLSSGKSKITLWDAKLYPPSPTAEESVTLALKIASAAMGLAEYSGPATFASMPRKSMEDIISTKDLDQILSSRKKLRATIMATLAAVN